MLLLLLLCFLLGAVTGCAVGSKAQSVPEPFSGAVSGSADFTSSAFFSALWKVSRYHLVTLLAATSVAGVAVIPLTSFFRGYFLSCAAAALMASLPAHGVLAALVSCGCSALLTVPTLFLLELDAFDLSARLRAVSSGKSYDLNVRSLPVDLLLSAVSLLLAAVVECLLVPWLLSRIFQ